MKNLKLIYLIPLFLFGRVGKSFFWWTNIVPFNKWRKNEITIMKDFWFLITSIDFFFVWYFFGWLWLIVAFLCVCFIFFIFVSLTLNQVNKIEIDEN